MTCIGHDIIDLKLAKKESNIFRRGYLDKILTEHEQSLMQKTADPFLCYWQMWSMKEAVYKILRQKGESRGYYPKKIEVKKLDLINGQVCYGKYFFYTQTTLNTEFIETIALEEYNQFKHVIRLKNNILLNKKEEMPFLTNNERPIAVSKSHHGKFESILTIVIN
jgi:phosphopantetheinyl transferase (holo-ACP synthase)